MDSVTLQVVDTQEKPEGSNDLKKGEHCNIVIIMADNDYLIETDGYMSGEIFQKISIDRDENRIHIIGSEFTDGTDKTGEKVNSTTEAEWYATGRYNRNSADPSEARTAENLTGLDPDESEGDTVGYYWNNYRYSGYDEPKEAPSSPELVNILGLPMIPMLMTKKRTYSTSVSSKTTKSWNRKRL